MTTKEIVVYAINVRLMALKEDRSSREYRETPWLAQNIEDQITVLEGMLAHENKWCIAAQYNGEKE